MSETLFDEYIKYHPNLSYTLDLFNNQDKMRIYKRLQNEKDRNNFISTISEIRFGEFFRSLDFQVDYDKLFETKQRPDWTITLKNSMAICDVYRLGKSQIDQIRNDFENSLFQRIETIEGNCCIKIGFLNEYFEPKNYDIDQIFSGFQCWFNASEREKGEIITLFENFEFEIFQSHTKRKHLTCVGNANSINIKPFKLKQHPDLCPNELTKKLYKYKNLIECLNTPYFICVDIDFESGFEHEDFEEYFRGSQVEFIDYGSLLGNLEQFRHLGKQWTELGVFYSNLQLSGIITLYNGKFKPLLNPSRKQTIYQSINKELLDKFEKFQT